MQYIPFTAAWTTSRLGTQVLRQTCQSQGEPLLGEEAEWADRLPAWVPCGFNDLSFVTSSPLQPKISYFETTNNKPPLLTPNLTSRVCRDDPVNAEMAIEPVVAHASELIIK